MDSYWLTNELRRTAPRIEAYLDRIANSLEEMAWAMAATREDDKLEYPLCEWCDHRHFPTSICLVDDCDCTAGGLKNDG